MVGRPPKSLQNLAGLATSTTPAVSSSVDTGRPVRIGTTLHRCDGFTAGEITSSSTELTPVFSFSEESVEESPKIAAHFVAKVSDGFLVTFNVVIVVFFFFLVIIIILIALFSFIKLSKE
jgi:hypothetical protein